MEQSTKNQVFYWVGAFVLVVFAYSAFLYANSYSKMVQPGSYRTFAVTAESKVTAKNDIAQFTYSVVIQGGKDIAQIKKQSDDLTAKIGQALKSQGVLDEDITTVSYNLEPRYQYFNCSPTAIGVPCRPSEIVGYNLNQTDSVKIRDLSKVEAIVSGVVAAGANNVSQLAFTVDDQTSLQTEAKAAAIKKAIEQAKVLAEAGGFRVGRIITIDENAGPIPYYSEGLGGARDMAVKSTPSVANLNPGSNDISSTVTVRFEIE